MHIRLRTALALTWMLCFTLVSGGFVMQYAIGLEPCPMCIVQRYAYIVLGIIAFCSWQWGRRSCNRWSALAAAATAIAGAYVAARQSWLQWYPPEVLSCGRDFYGMVQTFPLSRALPMIFAGKGDCSAVDWSLLGLTIANWSFLAFCALALLLLWAWWRSFRQETLPFRG